MPPPSCACPRRRWSPSGPPGAPGSGPRTTRSSRQLVKANTEAVCIVAKASKMHVTDALRTTLDEAVAMAADSVRFLREHDLRVFFDAEHFFDGYRDDPEFSVRVLRAAEEAGVEAIVLCDTNGGTLPHDVERIVAAVVGGLRVPGRACTSTTTRGARWPTPSRRCAPGPPTSRGA